MGKALLVAVFGLSFAFGAFGKTFTYKLKGYPKSAAGCHATARQVGDKVTQAGVAVKLARCLSDAADGYNITVEYEAEEPIALVTTGSEGKIDLYEREVYVKLADCQADLSKQAEIFQTETGLTPLFSYCQLGGFDHDRYRYQARIDAIGTASRKPYVDGFLLFVLPQDYAPGQLQSEVIAATRPFGITTTHVRTHSQGVYAHVSVSYYATERWKFNAEKYAVMPTKEQCQGEVAIAKTALAAFDQATLAVFCGKASMTGFELTAAFAGELKMKTNLSIEGFKNFAECFSARPALVAKYKTELGIPVEGGICTSTSSGQYRVLMFEH